MTSFLRGERVLGFLNITGTQYNSVPFRESTPVFLRNYAKYIIFILYLQGAKNSTKANLSPFTTCREENEISLER